MGIGVQLAPRVSNKYIRKEAFLKFFTYNSVANSLTQFRLDKNQAWSAFKLLTNLPDKTTYLKMIFFSQPKHVVGTQKNCLNEMVLLSIQNICFNWWIKNNHNNRIITLKNFALKLDLWFDTLQGCSQNAESYAHQSQTTWSSNDSLQLCPCSKWKLLSKERIFSQRERILSFKSGSLLYGKSLITLGDLPWMLLFLLRTCFYMHV